MWSPRWESNPRPFDYETNARRPTSAVSGNVCPFNDGVEALVAGVAVSPCDVAADHAGLLGMGGVVSAVEREVAQRGELGLNPVEPARVGRGIGQLDVVGCCPVANAWVVAGAQVGAEVVQHEPDPHAGGYRVRR